jgi:hypothetical protein
VVDEVAGLSPSPTGPPACGSARVQGRPAAAPVRSPAWPRRRLPLLRLPSPGLRAGELEEERRTRRRRTSQLEPCPPPLPLALLRRLFFSSTPSCCWRGATTSPVGPANRPSRASASPGHMKKNWGRQNFPISLEETATAVKTRKVSSRDFSRAPVRMV